MIPRIVPKAQLETAMGVFNLTLQASFAVGFAFLGPARSWRSPVRRSCSASSRSSTRRPRSRRSSCPRRRRSPASPASRAGAIHEPIDQLREGLAAISGNREVGRPLIHLAAAASLVGVIGVLGPNLAPSLGLDPKNLIVVVLPLGLGRRGRGVRPESARRPALARRAGEGGLIAFGLLAVGDRRRSARSGERSACRSIPLVAVLAFVAGSAYATTTVSAQTALFENMPAGVRGRVFGVLASIVSAASLLPILVAGPLADQISGATVIALAAIGVLIVAGWSATLFGPRVTAM